MKAPFVIYADCESNIEKYDTCIPPTERSSTTKTEVHKPCGFSFIAVRSDGSVTKTYNYRGEDCVRQFLSALLQTEAEIRESLKQKAPLNMSEEDWKAFHRARECHICKKDLFRYNAKDEIEFWHPETGEYCGKVHKFTRAPDSKSSCYSELLKIETQDENSKCIIKQWHHRVQESKEKAIAEGLNENDCFCCSMPLLQDKFRDAVRDHCHITGKFRSNRSYFRINPKKTIIPVLFHNLRGYDAHHLMQEIASVDANLKCIPSNMEKYISFSLGNLRFIDSYQFLLSSLDNLVASNKPEDFEIMKQFEPDDERRPLVLRKGVYPYEYVNSFERFNETSLPPKEAFYSTLTDSHISEEDYEHAKKVWEAYECETLGDYHDLYLATDTLLLADVFGNFRKICLKHYGLDPAHYYTNPGLSWNALLKITGVKLELLTDYNMYLFIEKGMRGSISTEMQRFCKANNPYLHDYDPEKETIYMVYFDANNLYGWAMSLPLPVGNFRWARKMPTEKQIMSWQVKRKTGYILEVDLEYPQELQEEHNSYPLAPERTQVPEEWYSPYQQSLARELGLTKDKTEKLLLTLRDKKNYVLHYRNLQLYLSLGMRLKKCTTCWPSTRKPGWSLISG